MAGRRLGVVRFQGTVWPLVWLVVPVLVEQVLALAVGFTDKWLAGNLFGDEEPLAAVGLVAYCLSFMPVLFAVPAVAATALVARSIGGGDLDGARRSAAQALLVGGVLAGVALVIFATAGSWFVGLLGLPEGSTTLAVRYLGIVLPALPAMMLIHVGVAVLRGAGDMVAGLIAMSVVNLVNAGASFALAVGYAGLPRLGWDGLAWGTLAGYVCGAACVGLLVARGSRGLRPRPGDLWPTAGRLRDVLRVGVPAGIDAVANACCHMTFLSIVNRLGNLHAAAHAVAIAIESLAFLPGSSFQVAAATLSGQFLGAGDERRARASVRLSALACVALMTVAGIGFFIWADRLTAWFVRGAAADSGLADLTARLVRIVAFAQPPLALLMVFSGGLRGGGATRPPLLVNFIGLLVIRLPLAVLLAWPAVELPYGLGTLPAAGLGAVGAWYAMAADLTARGIAMLMIFTYTPWARVAVARGLDRA